VIERVLLAPVQRITCVPPVLQRDQLGRWQSLKDILDAVDAFHDISIVLARLIPLGLPQVPVPREPGDGNGAKKKDYEWRIERVPESGNHTELRAIVIVGIVDLRRLAIAILGPRGIPRYVGDDASGEILASAAC
jgi:hypothetical protein